MAEPATTAAGVVAGVAAGAVTVMGAQVDAIVVAVVAAFLSAILVPTIDGRFKAGAAVALAALAAGYGAHVTATWLAPKVGADPESLRLLVALCFGVVGPAAIPAAIKRFTREVETRGAQ